MSDEKAGRTVVLKNGKVVRRGISAEERKSIRQETARKARAAMKEKRALEAAMRAQEEAEVAEVLKKDSGILGEEPLTDAREERYCQLVCSGVKEVEAWQRAYKTELGEPRAKGMTASTPTVTETQMSASCSESVSVLNSISANTAAFLSLSTGLKQVAKHLKVWARTKWNTPRFPSATNGRFSLQIQSARRNRQPQRTCLSDLKILREKEEAGRKGRPACFLREEQTFPQNF